MTEYDLSNGLSQLADDADPAPIDTYDVIAKAKARTRNRRASAATAFGTVAVVGALAFTLGFPNADESGTGVGSQTSTAPSEICPPDSGGKCFPAPVIDEHSEALDSQLAAALDELIPPGYTVEQDPFKTVEKLKFTGTKNPSGSMVYTASAWLRDSQGPSAFEIYVLKQPAGTPLGHADGQYFGPCTAGESHCEIKTLPDGTEATARENARPPALQAASTLTAQRPDGTYIQVITSVGLGPVPSETPRPIPALTNADLFKFATVFSLAGAPDAAAAADTPDSPSSVESTGIESETSTTAVYDDQLAAAGGIPSRYTVEGAGGTNPTTFQEAPDSTKTSRYFVQVSLVAEGERSSFSIWVMAKKDTDGDPGRCGDDANCTEHQQSDGTLAAVRTEERSDETILTLSALRPDGTVITVDHSGDPDSKLLTEDELLTYATAFTY